MVYWTKNGIKKPLTQLIIIFVVLEKTNCVSLLSYLYIESEKMFQIKKKTNVT